MAESFAFGTADRVVGKLASLAVQEVSLAWSVKSQVEELKDTMSTIRPLLLDAEEKQAKDHRLSIWLGKLKDVFYEAEDVVDEVEYEALRQQAESITEQVLNFFSSSNPLAFRLKIGHKMKNIRERLDKIGAEKSQFNLAERFEGRPVFYREREMTHSFVRASDVIGRESDKENIVGLLMQPSDGEKVSVIPIVGIGGLGKTTLAKLVYNDRRVVDHFDRKLWVCVSQDFDVQRLTKEILTCATDGNEKCDQLSIDQLQERLRHALENIKFLLVFDDVWDMDRDKWLELKALMMDGAEGSKIIVTTRSKLVASTVGTSSEHELKGLSDGECLSLLVKCAFKDGESKRYPNLVKIGKDIVRKCGGVPLAVRTLGGLLYLKTEQHDWVSVRDNEIWELEQKKDDILPALKLSYDELSFSLKQCFAFCSLFPKDFRFSNLELIQMWMAQGLIQSSEKNKEMEAIGNRYINELLVRSFFQDVEEDIQRVWYYFKMHDLVHDLALFVAQPECSMLNFRNENISRRVRHISYFNSQWPEEEEEGEVVRFLGKLSDLRTISLPIIKVGPRSLSFVATSISRFKHMRVLDLTNSRFKVLPNSICNLKYLRYLSLSNNNKIRKLPNSICMLHHLLVLLLDGCVSLEELPRDTGKMMSLRHLEITTKETAVLHKKKGVGRRCFNSLRLLCVRQCDYMDSLMEGMQSLNALRTLVIADCYGRGSLPKHLTALETLLICNCINLDLRIRDGEIADGIQGFGSLQVLGIWELPRLETLPRWLLQGHTSKTLHHLLIHDCKTLRALSEEEGMLNLISLETLVIEECPEFSALPEGMHHLTALRRLDIRDCRKLSALPEGMRHLPALTQLKIERCNKILIRRCKPGIGEDWDKIAHVLDIYLDGEKIESTTTNQVRKKRGAGGLKLHPNPRNDILQLWKHA